MEILLTASRSKLNAALEIYFASVDGYQVFDPTRDYTPKEREPLDALCDRYMRAYESALKFFRTWEQVREAAPSETHRDLLLRMEKLGFVSSLQAWLVLRDLRNRIAHEYLPGELAKVYATMVGQAAHEFRQLQQKINSIT